MTRHYDLIAWGYESLTELLHGRHRLEAVGLLNLREGQSVLDVPCGTGANLPLLEDRVGPSGRVLASDFSAGMLARAQAKVDREGWRNTTLVQADARELTGSAFDVESVDAVICMLGLTVIPDWERAFDRMWDLLAPGGRFVIMDLYLDGTPLSGAARSVVAYRNPPSDLRISIGRSRSANA